MGDDSQDRSASKPWLAVGFLLAIGATLALVLTDDLRWIRLAVVAALWAALIGALMAAKYRKQAALSEKSAVKAQRIYELELQKEIAARREHELEVEAETRQRIEAETRDELELLREELKTLRENLQNLFDGEVLWERVALTAQSTRMRKLGEEPRLVTVSEDANGHPAQITVGEDSAEQSDSPTELIGRIRDSDAESADDAEEAAMPRAEQPRRRQPGAPRTRFVPRPSRPAEDGGSHQQPAEPRTRRVRPRLGTAMARASEGASRARAEMSRPQQRPVSRVNGEAGSGSYAPYRAPGNAGDARGETAERSRATAAAEGWVAQALNPDGPTATQRRRRPAVEEAPTRTQAPVDPRTTVTAPVSRGRGLGDAARNTPPESPEEATSIAEPVVEATMEAAVPEGESTPESAQSEPNPTLPPEIGAVREPGGRRRRAESDDDATSTTESSRSSGGRRYRADDEEPAWMSAVPSKGRRRAAEPTESADDEPSGSHSKGRSVSELLAAYGAGNITPRRRRRAAD